MIEFKNITFKYDTSKSYILKDLSFKINTGDFVSIVGTSGIGKSTIMKLINGLLKPESGDVTIDNTSITNLKNYCGYMPQNDLLLPWRTVFKNLALPLEIAKIDAKERDTKVKKFLSDVSLLDYIYKYPRELSGGIKQRISFGRAIIGGQKLLLLDEPFSSLDYFTRIELRNWLLNIKKLYNLTIVLITHDVDEAIYLSDKILSITKTPITYLELINNPLEANKEDIIDKLRRTSHD